MVTDTNEPCVSQPRLDGPRLLYISQLEMRLEAFQTIASRLGRGAVRSVDTDLLEREAHKLTGTGATYGYPAITTAAAELERFLLTGNRDSVAIKALLDTLVLEIDSAVQAAPVQTTRLGVIATSAANVARPPTPRVLIVDDDPDIVNVVRAAIGAFANVEAATDGQAALRAISLARYDLILLDYTLPDMTGREVIRRIGPEVAGKTPIIMLTAMRQANIVAQLLRAGVAGYVAKPIDPALLLQRVTQYLARQAPLVLIADDDPLVREVLKERFRLSGAQVVLASTCAGALDSATRLRPHLTILDRKIGASDGLDVLVALRLAECTANLPVVVLSAKRERSDIAEAYRCGANDYITKPFLPRDVVDRCLGYFQMAPTRS